MPSIQACLRNAEKLIAVAKADEDVLAEVAWMPFAELHRLTLFPAHWAMRFRLRKRAHMRRFSMTGSSRWASPE